MSLKKVTAPVNRPASNPRPWSSLMKPPTHGEPHWVKATIIYPNMPSLGAGLHLMAHLRFGDFVLSGYFARYTTPPFRIEMQLYTRMSMTSLHKIIMAYKFNNTPALGVTFEKCTGSVAHARACQVVLDLMDAAVLNASQMVDLIHWMWNMAGFSYVQEAGFASIEAFNALRNVQGWTDTAIFGVRPSRRQCKLHRASRKTVNRPYKKT